MPKLKIMYSNDTEEIVAALNCDPVGEWIIFSDASRSVILQVRAAEVKRIERAA